MYWDKHHECMDRESLRALQNQRLRRTVDRMYGKVPYYRNKMQSMNLSPADIQSVDDLHKLPFMTKQDLRANYPYGLFAVPMSEVVRIHASSGTTGQPTVVGYTQRDIDTWSELMARTMVLGGVGEKDIVQVAFGYGLFTGGLGVHYGAERAGASVVPISGGNSRRQVRLMRDFGVTVLACTPSYALHLAEALAEEGIALDELKLRCGIFGAEPWSEAMRKEVETRLGIKATDIYGLSEIIGPGVAGECQYQCGLHVAEDHFIPEIIDPDTGEVLPAGAEGELVISTITKEGIPILRYRTRDITSLNYETCECGRTLVRIKKILGRSDDMLIIRGVNVFPTQIEEVLMEIAGVEPHYQLVVDREDNLDSLEVQVEISGEMFSDEVRRIEELRMRIVRELSSALGISLRVKLMELHSIPRSEGKAARIIDKRTV